MAPPTLTVAAGRVEETDGAVPAFVVTLSRAPSATVTVDYEKRDGTTRDGFDYTTASGTSTLHVGRRDRRPRQGREDLTLLPSNDAVDPAGAHGADRAVVARPGSRRRRGGRMAYGTHQMHRTGDQVNAAVGCGLPVGDRFIGNAQDRLRAYGA